MKFRFVFALSLALSFWGCADRVRYIGATDEYVSASLDLKDIKEAAKKSLDSLFQSGYYARLDVRKPQVLAISDFINDTTFKLDMEQITARIIEELQNGGRFLVTRAMSGSGGSVDAMIDKSRKAREDEEYDQMKVIEKGQKVSADISLSGKVGQRVTRVGGDQRVDYFFKIEIVDLKSGLSLWSKTIDISKLSPGTQSVW